MNLSKIAAQKLGQFINTDPRVTPDERPDPQPPVPSGEGVRTLSGEYISAYADQLDQELGGYNPNGHSSPVKVTPPQNVQVGRDIRYVRLLAENGDEIATVPINNLRIERSMGAEVRIEMEVRLHL